MAKNRNTKHYFNVELNVKPVSLPTFDTLICFDSNYRETNLSPIDNCLDKIQQLNLIHVNFLKLPNINSQEIHTLYNLIVLGYISAIESYLREIFRKIIIIDDYSRINCEAIEISFGAAISYQKHLIPEAILEKASFASKKNIIDGIKNYLGLKGNIPAELETTLDEFEKACHLRHCIVHRFGKLGSNNAIKLGLDKHMEILEKPLKIDNNIFYNLSVICLNTIFVLNSYLFKSILERTAAKNSNIWSWDFRKDRKAFLEYYSLFDSVERPSNNKLDVKKTYEELKKFNHNL